MMKKLRLRLGSFGFGLGPSAFRKLTRSEKHVRPPPTAARGRQGAVKKDGKSEKMNRIE
jgi:hypothetical protein